MSGVVVTGAQADNARRPAGIYQDGGIFRRQYTLGPSAGLERMTVGPFTPAPRWGGGRNSTMRRMMSANKFLGMATSVI